MPSLFLAPALVLAPLAFQEPKVGRDTYADEVEHGFEIKVPKGWHQIPPEPGDDNMLVKYSAPNSDYIMVSGGELLFVNVWLIVIDEREEDPDLEDEEEDEGESDPLLTWLDRHEPNGLTWRYEGKRKKLKTKGVEAAASFLCVAEHRRSPEYLIHAYIAEYELEPGLRICLVGNGPSDRKWRGYQKAYDKMAKSFGRIEIDERFRAIADGLATPRDERRRKLEGDVAKLSGWSLYETNNYFVLSDVDDGEFIEELLERLEAIRSVYLEQYPPEQARAISKLIEEKEEEDGGDGEDPDVEKPTGDDDADGPEDERSRSVIAIDPIEASRMSVLRVCNSRDAYHEYGGPPGSAGYWNYVSEELVIYDDKAGGGRSDTWITLNHEAFHQYIFYFYGALSPHSWYNEGTGDFFSGYALKHKRFKLKENPWRVRRIQQALREDDYCPLPEFVTWSKQEYYGDNDRDLGAGHNYAQGWSFIYFLRTGPKAKPRGWNPAWEGILDTYLVTLATSGDLDQAVETAFAGVDWGALEDAWKKYTLSL